MLSKQTILGVGITDEAKQKVLEYTLQSLKHPSKPFFIVTPNPEILVYASKHFSFKPILNEAWIALPDGVGVVLAGRVLGKPLKTRFTGVDFIEMLCKSSRDYPLSMGFLGGRRGVAQATAECLKKKYPWIKVAFVGEEWNESGFINQEASSWQMVDREKNSSPTTNYQLPSTHIDILFVAYGFPKQEEWIYHNLKNLPVTAAMGVGGAFDFLSGRIVRAPTPIRALGLEWLFRLIRQPWRIKRQLALLEFIYLVLTDFFAKRRG